MQAKEERAAVRKEYYLKNKEKLKARTRAWAQANPDRIKEFRNQYKITRKDQRRAYHLKYYAENSARLKARHDSYKGKYNRLKNSAKWRGLVFDISFEQYLDVIKEASCIYCDSTLPPRGYGLDRIDSLVGYIVGNVVPCCKICNYMFSNYNKDFIFEHMKKVLKKQNT